MKKFIVETYYTCTFKTVHSLNDLNDNELSKIDQRKDGEESRDQISGRGHLPNAIEVRTPGLDQQKAKDRSRRISRPIRDRHCSAPIMSASQSQDTQDGSNRGIRLG